MKFICLQRLCALREDMFECQDSAVPSISPPPCKLNWLFDMKPSHTWRVRKFVQIDPNDLYPEQWPLV
ncbi:unnamed protein product [Brassica oleracea]